MELIEVAEPFIEALLVWRASRVLQAESPFANCTGAVTGLFQKLGHGLIFPSQRNRGVSANDSVARVAAGQEHTTRRGTDRAAGVTLGEAHAFRREPVKVRRFDF